MILGANLGAEVLSRRLTGYNVDEAIQKGKRNPAGTGPIDLKDVTWNAKTRRDVGAAIQQAVHEHGARRLMARDVTAIPSEDLGRFVEVALQSQSQSASRHRRAEAYAPQVATAAGALNLLGGTIPWSSDMARSQYAVAQNPFAVVAPAGYNANGMRPISR